MTTEFTPAVRRAAMELPLVRLALAHRILDAGLDVEEIAALMRTHRTWTERWNGSIERQYTCLCGEPLPVKRNVLLAPLADAQAKHQARAVRASILGES